MTHIKIEKDEVVIPELDWQYFDPFYPGNGTFDNCTTE